MGKNMPDINLMSIVVYGCNLFYTCIDRYLSTEYRLMLNLMICCTVIVRARRKRIVMFSAKHNNAGCCGPFALHEAVLAFDDKL